MPRRKPIGWPKLMVGRRLKSGATAYYWVPPTWAVKAGCKMRSEALGTDYAEAKRRCDELLNPHFDAWRLRDETPPADERSRRHVRLDGGCSEVITQVAEAPGYREELRRRAAAGFGVRVEGRA